MQLCRNQPKKINKGFPTEEQCLFFQRKKLEDDRTVSDSNIRNKSTLNLSLQVLAEKMYRLEVIILTEDRRLINLAVRRTDSILDLKQKTDVTQTQNKQILHFADRELENTRTISDHSIRNKSVIHLVVKVHVVTSLSQEGMTLELRPKDTVESVKDKIHAQKSSDATRASVSVVYYVVITLFCCIGTGIGKSLIRIGVESVTSPLA